LKLTKFCHFLFMALMSLQRTTMELVI
jgi:hypothetical protein